jgi:hypothetical protein
VSNVEDDKDERKFLHDIATPISILKLHSVRLIKLFEERGATETEQRLLKQIIKSIKSIEDLHASEKSRLSQTKAS